MGNDLPDYQSEVVSTVGEATSLTGGADASKSSSPTAKQIYLATDTKRLYYCVADGAWADYFFGVAQTETLTNKTLTTPIIATLYQDAGKTNLLTMPAATDTLVGKATTDTLANKTLTTPVIATLYQDAGKTNLLTMPAATDTLVGKATTDTLTNKTLTTPIIATLYQDAGKTNLLTMPAATDTLVGKATTDELTNKTLNAAVAKGTWTASGTWTIPAVTLGGDITINSKKMDAGAGALTIFSTAVNVLTLRSDQDTVNGSRITLFHNNVASPADNDVVGELVALAYNDVSQQVNYGYYRLTSADVSDGSEDGVFQLYLIQAGSNNLVQTITSGGDMTLAGGLIETDANASQAEPGRSVDTVYQNTSGKIRLVSITFDTDSGDEAAVYCDASTPPTTKVAAEGYASGSGVITGQLVFVVPPNYYYKVTTASGTLGVVEWFEYDLH